MTHVTCRLTAKNRDQLRNPTLGNRAMGYLYLFTDEKMLAMVTPKTTKMAV